MDSFDMPPPQPADRQRLRALIASHQLAGLLSNAQTAELSDGQIIEMSVRYADKLLEKLNA